MYVFLLENVSARRASWKFLDPILNKFAAEVEEKDLQEKTFVATGRSSGGRCWLPLIDD